MEWIYNQFKVKASTLSEAFTIAVSQYVNQLSPGIVLPTISGSVFYVKYGDIDVGISVKAQGKHRAYLYNSYLGQGRYGRVLGTGRKIIDVFLEQVNEQYGFEPYNICVGFPWASSDEFKSNISTSLSWRNIGDIVRWSDIKYGDIISHDHEIVKIIAVGDDNFIGRSYAVDEEALFNKSLEWKYHA
jgi:hypothetical protein